MSGLDAQVIIVGGGPAGSTLGWALARGGVEVLILERARMPREKVCGDYVDPRGLQVLDAMGCLRELERGRPPRVTRTATYVDWERHFDGPIPFYGESAHLPGHGYTIPRSTLDEAMLAAAARAGAKVLEQAAVDAVEAGTAGVTVRAGREGARLRLRGSLVAGADGVNSIVARGRGMRIEDPRRSVVARRAYAQVEPAEERHGTAEIFFDESSFPGYAWMFPAGGGRVNLGVGILSEARERFSLQVPALFEQFVEGLRRHHPRCAQLQLVSKPIGGTVHTYGAGHANHFDGGVLIGDAGGFVDPMTGEGITPAMESALLAAPVLASAIEHGDCSARALEPYSDSFHAYFDPAMIFLDFCAQMLRNRHLKRPWLKALTRGCQIAQQDAGFARTSGSYFGGLEIRPLDIIGQVWSRCLQDVLLAWPRMVGARRSARGRGAHGTSPAELLDWQLALARSLVSDPGWHIGWMLDMQRDWTRLLASAATGAHDPRAQGLLAPA